MSLKISYSPLMIRRAREIKEEVEAARPPGAGRHLVRDEDYCQTKYRLSYDYLLGVVNGRYRSPSVRVLRNLGLQLFVRDPRTGETEEISLRGPVDWNPRAPRDDRDS